MRNVDSTRNKNLTSTGLNDLDKLKKSYENKYDFYTMIYDWIRYLYKTMEYLYANEIEANLYGVAIKS